MKNISILSLGLVLVILLVGFNLTQAQETPALSGPTIQVSPTPPASTAQPPAAAPATTETQTPGAAPGAVSPTTAPSGGQTPAGAVESLPHLAPTPANREVALKSLDDAFVVIQNGRSLLAEGKIAEGVVKLEEGMKMLRQAVSMMKGKKMMRGVEAPAGLEMKKERIKEQAARQIKKIERKTEKKLQKIEKKIEKKR